MINIPRAYLSTASTTRDDARRLFRADVYASAAVVYVFSIARVIRVPAALLPPFDKYYNINAI